MYFYNLGRDNYITNNTKGTLQFNYAKLTLSEPSYCRVINDFTCTLILHNSTSDTSRTQDRTAISLQHSFVSSLTVFTLPVSCVVVKIIMGDAQKLDGALAFIITYIYNLDSILGQVKMRSTDIYISVIIPVINIIRELSGLRDNIFICDVIN